MWSVQQQQSVFAARLCHNVDTSPWLGCLLLRQLQMAYRADRFLPKGNRTGLHAASINRYHVAGYRGRCQRCHSLSLHKTTAAFDRPLISSAQTGGLNLIRVLLSPTRLTQALCLFRPPLRITEQGLSFQLAVFHPYRALRGLVDGAQAKANVLLKNVDPKEQKEKTKALHDGARDAVDDMMVRRKRHSHLLRFFVVKLAVYESVSMVFVR